GDWKGTFTLTGPGACRLPTRNAPPARGYPEKLGAAAMTPIHIRALTRRYGPRRGVEDVNLVVPEGSLFGFLGPNGAGKTTTIRVLLGLLRPTSGTATVFGQDCWRNSAAIKAEVGYIPGDVRLYPWMTGESALSIFGRVRGRDLFGAGRDLAQRFALDLRVRV